MKILIVEDNQTIWDSIKKLLESKWYEAHLARDKQIAEQLFDNTNYNLLVLDLMLPGGDWMEFCDYVRKKTNIPIIITTSKSQLEDKLKGFDTGADDYLVKPFDLEELEARIKSLLKRTNQIDDFDFGNIQVFLKQRKVLKNGDPINLTNKEFLILECLLKNIGKTISRTDIIDYVWGGDIFENDNKLDVYISNIRKKTNKNIINTVKWYWYRIDQVSS